MSWTDDLLWQVVEKDALAVIKAYKNVDIGLNLLKSPNCPTTLPAN